MGEWRRRQSEGVNRADDGDTVSVFEGTYYEAIDFGGKGITLRSTDANDSGVVSGTIIDGNNPSSNTVRFATVEDANSIISGFTITGGYAGIYINSSSPVISKCVIRDNAYCGMYCSSSFPAVSNCIISNNSDYAVRCILSSPTITNCTVVGHDSYGIYNSSGQIKNCILWENNDDLYDCSATYSYVGDGDEGGGNIDGPVYFADPAGDDYHLLSYSKCIDAGDPNWDYSKEPGGGGGRVNMGAYGNTGEASLASADIDGDDMPDDWEDEYGLNAADPCDANGDYDVDGMVNLDEYNYGCEPNNADSDSDGMPDGWEHYYGLDPLDDSDASSDADD
ncbi:MAG: right-handed parallel beta-helix repeat-containing protein, partial [Planctomycetota bacterium]